MKKKKILAFFGTRPEAIKMAPVIRELNRQPWAKPIVVVSAQHRTMLDQVLRIFNLKPGDDLNVMRVNQSLFDITQKVIQGFERVLKRHQPDLVLVHGDTTTSFAGALACYYQKIPIGHVEAGLRSHDLYRPFPEEANRRLTDVLCQLHFAPTSEAKKNLLNENVNSSGMFVTGNTVIDALKSTSRLKIQINNKRVRLILSHAKKNRNPIVLLTAHRRENFGAPFQRVFGAVKKLATSPRFLDTQWIYPVHPNPNVKKAAKKYLQKIPNVHLVEPMAYADMVKVMMVAKIILTDSGGLQEEAPSLGKPVLVLRDVTERPEAVKAGTVKLVGTNENKIISEVTKLMTNQSYYKQMSDAVNPYGDGYASKRIVQAIGWYFQRGKKPKPFRY